MINLYYWVIILFIQNAAFTWVSRARNSGSIVYHGIASIFSNGVWFVSQLILITAVVKPGMGIMELTKLGILYIIGTTSGSIAMHWVSMKYFEKGKRKVGS